LSGSFVRVRPRARTSHRAVNLLLIRVNELNTDDASDLSVVKEELGPGMVSFSCLDND
ncbi:uncharacterized, partial [Tachysurus ichikawai]